MQSGNERCKEKTECMKLSNTQSTKVSVIKSDKKRVSTYPFLESILATSTDAFRDRRAG